MIIYFVLFDGVNKSYKPKWSVSHLDRMAEDKETKESYSYRGSVFGLRLAHMEHNVNNIDAISASVSEETFRIPSPGSLGEKFFLV